MDLTPPLTRSPASPPNSYCPSEGSSLDYPSPGLTTQHYKLSSLYSRDLSCGMAPPMDSEHALPPLDALGQAEWSQSALLQPASTSTAIPSMVSAEYDAFGGYQQHLPHHYGADVYVANAAQEPALSATPPNRHSLSRSPIPPISRPQFAPDIPSSGLGAPRVKLEQHPDYSLTDMSQYAAPRALPSHYNADPDAYISASGGYLAENQMSAWGKSEYIPVDADPYYGGASGHPDAAMQDRSAKGGARPRRTPRRLTTKEEANFQCEVKGCGKLFSRSYNFKAHMETHDEKREYPFPCQVHGCSKKFVRKTDLQRHHQSVHMKERNHKCDYCGRLFARKDTLRR